jgi:iron complex outermembrane recepter protein
LVANGYEQFQTRNLGTHSLVFGVEAVRQDWQARFGTARDSGRGGPVPVIDLFTPVYGLTRGELYPIAPGAFTNQSIQSRRVGFFGQDQITLSPRWSVLVGGRVEQLKDEGLAPLPVLAENTAVTGRLGTVYRLAPWLSAFGSVSNSFNRAPVLAQNPSANGPHDPETGVQWETGVKADALQGRLFLTSSVFHITKSNVLRPDPNFGPGGDNFSAVLPVGKARSQGFECDLTARITSDIRLIANYAFLDTTILEDGVTPFTVGQPLPNTPRHAFGLFVNYFVKKTGTTLSAGNETRGLRREPFAGIAAPGYSIWDVGLSQRVHRLIELRSQLTNAFDELYATSSLFAARAGNFPGDPRTFTVGLHFQWARD